MSTLIFIYVVMTLLFLISEARWKMPNSYLFSIIHQIINDIKSGTFTPYHDSILTNNYWKKFSKNDLFNNRVTKLWVAAAWPLSVIVIIALFGVITLVFCIVLILGTFSELRKEKA